MVRRGSHGADTVSPSGKATSDCSRETAIAITGVVDTFEELKDGWVWGSGAV